MMNKMSELVVAVPLYNKQKSGVKLMKRAREPRRSSDRC